MKKLFAIVLALALCLSVLSVGAFAAEGDVTIHVQIPAEWASLNIHYWGCDNVGDTSWPGEAITEKDADGWYTFQVPAGADGIVLSANGAPQSENISLVGTECWIMVHEEKSGNNHRVTVLDHKPADGEIDGPGAPEMPVIDYMEVMGAGLEGIGWTTGSSVKMEVVSEYVYKATFANVAPGTYEVKFAANGSWDFNLGGTFMALGESTDAYRNGDNINFSIAETCDLVLTLDLTGFDPATENGAKFCIAVAAGEVVPPAPAKEITVYIKAPAAWEAVYIYSYPAQNGDWPGTQLEKSGEYYVVTLKEGFNGLVINNGAGQQTVDIVGVDTSKDEAWIVIGEANGEGKFEATTTYEAPQVEIVPPSGDQIHMVWAVMLVSAVCLVAVVSKKKYI